MMRLKKSTKSFGGAMQDPYNPSAMGSVDDAPVVQFVQQLLEQAVAVKASDLHFEPYEHHYRVRMRIDGELRDMASPAQALKDRIASRIKVLSRLDIAEKRLPQDGRMKLKLPGGREIDLRVSTLPTLFGEKLVVRVLDSAQVQLDLNRLVLGFLRDGASVPRFSSGPDCVSQCSMRPDSSRPRSSSRSATCSSWRVVSPSWQPACHRLPRTCRSIVDRLRR
jgi:hypothetical protein